MFLLIDFLLQLVDDLSGILFAADGIFHRVDLVANEITRHKVGAFAIQFTNTGRLYTQGFRHR
jgi:hypothetical protein